MSSDELFVLDPRLGRDSDSPAGSRWDAAMKALLDRPTVSGMDTLREANKRVEVDVSAAMRLWRARNRAIHVGDVDRSAVTDMLGAFSRSAPRCGWAGALRRRTLGKPERDSRHEAHVDKQELDSRGSRPGSPITRDWQTLGLGGSRRAALRPGGPGATCPSCRNEALLSTMPIGSAPEGCITVAERQSPVRCKLTVAEAAPRRGQDARGRHRVGNFGVRLAGGSIRRHRQPTLT